MSRPVVVHYHLFKNAGTSLDRTLQDNFGDAWTELEGAGRRPLSPAELGDFLSAATNISAVSSHTAVLPPPEVAGLRLIPILFVRHPLDRLRSIYDFERLQAADTPGALKAKEVDMAGYFEWRLARPRDQSAESFQTARLARGTAGDGGPLERALQTVSELPFVGVVEEFDASLVRLHDVLVGYFPRITLKSYRANVTSNGYALDQRLEQLRRRLGEELYVRLEKANRDDLELWTRVRARFSPPREAD